METINIFIFTLRSENGEAGKDVCQTMKYFISLENTMPSNRKNYFKITVEPGQPTLKGINISFILLCASQI